MTRHFDIDRAIEEWLEDGPTVLPDRVIDAIANQLHHTNQRRLGWLPGRYEMNRTLLTVGGVAAAVALVAVAGAMFLGLNVNPLGVGGRPSPSPTPSPAPTVAVSPSAEPTTPPTASPPPSATPRSNPEGGLAPGTYAAHPLPPPDDSLTLTFTVPEWGWEAMFGTTALVPAGQPGTEAPGGTFILFDDVTTLNGDPCNWSGTDDDVSVGLAVDDLVDALLAQTAYEVSGPVDVSIGGYSGKRVDIVVPTAPFTGDAATAPECDEGVYRLWSTAAHGATPVYAQGPANRWQVNILDVDGTRLVIVVADFPGTLPDDRAEMDAIVDSIAIQP